MTVVTASRSTAVLALALAGVGMGQTAGAITGIVLADSAISPAGPIGVPDAPWGSSEPPPSMPIEETPLDVPVAGLIDVPLPFGSLSFPSTMTTDGVAGSNGNVSGDAIEFSPPIALDPPDMVETPEPATFLMMGTGLLAAWRLARRKRED